MISFLLNDVLISTDKPPGMVLLDFIRYHQHLTGTKIGCREGDCGACTILCGEAKDDKLHYAAMTSCLMPLANVQGKHIVTVEGVNGTRPTAVQQAICDEAATQCGFCTPGIIMSLTGFCLQEHTDSKLNSAASLNAVESVDGNICRCTGYKSIERATQRIQRLMDEKTGKTLLQFLIRENILPPYFSTIKERLLQLTGNSRTNGLQGEPPPKGSSARLKFLGGGTDLYVQLHEEMELSGAKYLLDRPELKQIEQHGDSCVLGGAVNVSDMMDSSILRQLFPDIASYKKLISSTPIRNMATLAGNLVNASPIGDLTIFFLSLDAVLLVNNGSATRAVSLRTFYRGYKTLDLQPGEYIQHISFELPAQTSFFNFEKVSKRTNLDIASVNTAMLLDVDNGIITRAGLSAGGVGPVPAFLAETCAFLKNKALSVPVIQEALVIAQAEISPISDARGSATYKKLLLKQLIKAHFIRLFPQLNVQEIMRA